MGTFIAFRFEFLFPVLLSRKASGVMQAQHSLFFSRKAWFKRVYFLEIPLIVLFTLPNHKY
jgi:hypothetical protein